MEFLQTIQNQIIWKAQVCWLFMNTAAATILPKIKRHARTGGCVLQPRNALTAAEKSCSLKHYLPTLEKPAETLEPTMGNNKTFNIWINRKAPPTDLQVIF